jgi:hypothetical protein
MIILNLMGVIKYNRTFYKISKDFKLLQPSTLGHTPTQTNQECSISIFSIYKDSILVLIDCFIKTNTYN